MTESIAWLIVVSVLLAFFGTWCIADLAPKIRLIGVYSWILSFVCAFAAFLACR